MNNRITLKMADPFPWNATQNEAYNDTPGTQQLYIHVDFFRNT